MRITSWLFILVILGITWATLATLADKWAQAPITVEKDTITAVEDTAGLGMIGTHDFAKDTIANVYIFSAQPLTAHISIPLDPSDPNNWVQCLVDLAIMLNKTNHTLADSLLRQAGMTLFDEWDHPVAGALFNK